MSIINKISSQNYDFDIGTNFSNVYYNDENNFSLMDFFETFKDFLESDMFMIYSSLEPAADNIKIWYDTTVTTM